MSILASRYGFTRPRAIAAMLQRLQVALPNVPIIEAAPKPNRTGVAQVAQWQAERAEIRADLPMLRAAALESMYHGDGPSFADIAALESRLADLDDYLIFEPDFAENEMALAA
jgi:hypothetical protein